MTLPLIPWAKPDEIEQGIKDLKAAADRLESKGWTQHSYQDGAACCAAGAVNVVTNGDRFVNLFDSARQFNSRASIAMGIFHRMTGSDIATYNDAEGRTANQVIAKIRKVAAFAEGQLARELASITLTKLGGVHEA